MQMNDDVCAEVVEKYLTPALKESNLDPEMRGWLSSLATASLKELIARFAKQQLSPEALVAEGVRALGLNQESVLGHIRSIDGDYTLLGHIRSIDGDYTFACEEGCSYCCNSHVLAMPHEAINIFQNMLTGLEAGAIKKVREHCRKVARTWDEKQSVRLVKDYFAPCPFLENDRCQIYAFRPIACRNWFSQSVDACKQTFNSKNKLPVPQTAIVMHLKDVVYASHSALWEFAGADGNLASLFTALDALFDDADGVFEGWAKGQPLPGRVNDLR